eukprot:1145462-Pelagomonas_calceolata.AAC.6
MRQERVWRTGQLTLFAIVLAFVLQNKNAHLFFETSPQTNVSLGPTGPCYSEVSNEDVRHFLEQDLNQMYYFLPEITGVFCVAGRDQQTEQSNHLAEGQNTIGGGGGRDNGGALFVGGCGIWPGASVSTVQPTTTSKLHDTACMHVCVSVNWTCQDQMQCLITCSQRFERFLSFPKA